MSNTCEGCHGSGGNWDCLGENEGRCGCVNCTGCEACQECGGCGTYGDCGTCGGEGCHDEVCGCTGDEWDDEPEPSVVDVHMPGVSS